MLKREAEFSSHTVALPLLCLAGAGRCQHTARAVRRTHTTHTPLFPTRHPSAPPSQQHGWSISPALIVQVCPCLENPVSS